VPTDKKQIRTLYLTCPITSNKRENEKQKPLIGTFIQPFMFYKIIYY